MKSVKATIRVTLEYSIDTEYDDDWDDMDIADAINSEAGDKLSEKLNAYPPTVEVLNLEITQEAE